MILTTPSDQHADQTVLALSKGKHVQVEIPMALNLARLRAHAGGGEEGRQDCMVTHTRRFAAPHREIKRRIQEGTFHLHHMVVETYFFRRTNLNMHGQPRSWVDNLLWHHGCHSVDIAQWLVNDPDWEVWGQKGPDHTELGIPMDLTVAMKSKEGPLFSMAMSFNNKGPFGGFYRYIGEEDTYKVYRDSMTDSEGKEVPLDPLPAFDRQDIEFVGAHPRGTGTRIECRQLRADDGAARPDREGDGDRLQALGFRLQAMARARSPKPESPEPSMIIDCHGHYTTAPKELQAYRDAQIAGLKDPSHVARKAPSRSPTTRSARAWRTRS